MVGILPLDDSLSHWTVVMSFVLYCGRRERLKPFLLTIQLRNLPFVLTDKTSNCFALKPETADLCKYGSWINAMFALPSVRCLHRLAVAALLWWRLICTTCAITFFGVLLSSWLGPINLDMHFREAKISGPSRLFQ